MNKRQNRDGAKETLLFGPAVLTADNTPASVDLRDAQCVAINIFVGIGGITFDASNKIEFKLRHGDDATAANHTAVAAADVILPAGVTLASGGIVWALVAAQAAAEMRTIEYVGGKSHLSLLADFTGTHATGTTIAAKVRRSSGRNIPAL